MTFPTVPTAAAGRVLTANQADTSATRTFPDLGSLTFNAGDVLLAICVAYESSATDAAFSGWGAGFGEASDRSGAGTMAIGVAWKIATGSETGTFTVTQAGVTGHASMILLSIPGGHDTTAPSVSLKVNGTSAAADPGAHNPGAWDVEDTLWIAVAGSGLTSGTGAWTGVASAPTNYTDYADTATVDNSTVGQVEAAVAFRQNAVASEDVGPFSLDTSNARNSAVVVAVRPAAGTDATPTPGAVAAPAALPRPGVNVTVTFAGDFIDAGATSSPPADIYDGGDTATPPTDFVDSVTVPDPIPQSAPAALPQPAVAAAAGPAAVAATAAVPTPTVTTGGGTDATPTPAAVTAVAALPRPTVDVLTPPAAIPATAAAPRPLVDVVAGAAAVATSTTVPRPLVAVTASPAAITAPAALPRPQAHTAASPAAVALVAALATPTVIVGGAATATPAAVAATASVPRPLVNVAAGPSTTPAVLAAPAPTVTVAALVVPTPVALIVAAPGPLVTAGVGATATPAAVALVAALPVPPVGAGPPVVVAGIPVEFRDRAAGVTFRTVGVVFRDRPGTQF